MYVPETLMQRPRHADRPDVALPPGRAATIAFRRPDTTLDPRLFVPGGHRAAESATMITSCITMAYQATCKPILISGEPRRPIRPSAWEQRTPACRACLAASSARRRD